jgi:hypothetical protein
MSDLRFDICVVMMALQLFLGLLFSPTLGLSYLDPFLAGYPCYAGLDHDYIIRHHPQQQFILAILHWFRIMVALTGLPLIAHVYNTVEKVGRSARCSCKECKAKLPTASEVCHATMAMYLFLDPYFITGRTGFEARYGWRHHCAPDPAEVGLMFTGLYLHGWALVSYCARFRVRHERPGLLPSAVEYGTL